VNAINHDSNARRFSTNVDGLAAVLDYTVSDDTMIITHTAVPRPITGRGIGADLMRAALNAARSKGWKVDPACSYAEAYMRRHPDGRERQHEEDLLDEALEESFPASDPPSVGGST